MQRITYIISDIDKALAFEWIADHLDSRCFQLSFILLNPGPSRLEAFLFDKGLDTCTITCRGKKDWPAAIWATFKRLRTQKPDVVHCHLFQANIIGLIAAKLAGVGKRIYTRHHSSLHHVYHPKGIWWDNLSNRLATHIVAISPVVKSILLSWEKAAQRKVVLIPHGFDLSSFAAPSEERVAAFRKRAGIEKQYPVIGVISRFTEWKGVQYIIPAFKQLLQHHPNALLLLLNARGDYEQQILKLLHDLPPSSYRLIPFEQDISAAYKAMDVFVHVPIDEHSEAFGQIYVEALAAGVPSVFTRSGIANDADFNASVAKMVDHRNVDQIHDAIKDILRHPDKTQQMIVAGKSVAQKFELSTYIGQLEQLYSKD